MRRFLLILSPEHPTHGELSAGGFGRRTEAFAQWLHGLRASGALRGATRLHPRGARISRAGIDGATACWERGEPAAMSSCLLVEAEGIEAALALARGCPAVAPGCIDVHEVDRGTESGPFGGDA